MLKPATTLLVNALAGLLFSISAFAQTAIPAPAVAAKSWALIDVTSNQTLAVEHADERVEPASLTKLMTAYLAFAAIKQGTIKLEQTIGVSPQAWRTGGSRMFIEPKRPVTVNELLRGMIVQSGNDACIALAEAISGSEENFALLMNKEAARLGMKNSNFMNSTGLPDPKHYSTAQDMATLAAAIIRDFPEFYPLYSIREYRYNSITQPNRNRLLWMDPTVDGMKTGHTDAAGYCLVASAKRGERRLLSVVMGTVSDSARAQESQKVLNWGFLAYDTVRLYQKDQAVSTLHIWKGERNTLKSGFVQDLYVSVAKGRADKIKASMVSVQPLIAPVRYGQTIGTLKLTLDDKPLADIPVLALEDVPVAGIFGRGWDTIRLWFK